jgi:serine phosphatase RsbU (regulator of sigma subunit)
MTGRIARVRGSPIVGWAVASQAVAGQSASGDCHVVAPFPDGVLVAALDGLGHGDEAALAARKAARILEAQPQGSIVALLQECHHALLEMRGVVLSLASFNANDGTMTWAGVGNVEGLLLRADPEADPARESILLRAGVVGFQLPQLSAAVLPVAPGDTLVFATDGIRPEFAEGVLLGGQLQRVADRILARYAKGTDDALVLVVEYRGGAG